MENVINELKAALAEAKSQWTATGSVNNELKNDINKMQADIDALAQKMSKSPVGEKVETKSLGQTFVESAEFKSNPTRTGAVQVKTTIVNATLNTAQPNVDAQRVGMVAPVQRQLTIRNLIPTLPTASNLIKYPKATFTNSAALRTSEGSAFAESAFSFTLATAEVVSIGHFVPASKEALSDAPMMAAFVDNFMSYGLALKEEVEILTGDGTSGHMNGLIHQATAATYSAVAGDTQLDILREAISQAEQSGYSVDGIVLNPSDYAAIERIKDSEGRYVFGSPYANGVLNIWGVPVVKSLTMTASDFLVGNFGQACAIFDRKEASVEVSTEHSDYFTKNLVAIKADERLALAVYRPAALITGSLELYS